MVVQYRPPNQGVYALRVQNASADPLQQSSGLACHVYRLLEADLRKIVALTGIIA